MSGSSSQPTYRDKYFPTRVVLLVLSALLIIPTYFIIERLQTKPGSATTEPHAPGAITTEAAIFSSIYETKFWGTNSQGEGSSGSGSTMKATVVYRPFLQAFLRDHEIGSVVDAGCGDWEFSQAIDWSGVDYKGYDIVESVIANNRKKYAASHVKFFVADIVTDDLPVADLLICRHVLQHLPNRDVLKFRAQLPKYKHALLINSVDSRTYTAENVDIPTGGFRPLDVTRKPFDLPGRKALMYWDGSHMQLVVHLARK